MWRANGAPALIAVALGLATLVAASAETEAEEARAGTIVVRVTGCRTDSGKVWVFLYNQRKGFPRDRSKAMSKRAARIENGRAVVSWKGLPHGTYAAYAHHDEDDDGEMRTNWIGMPKEGIGATNNPRSLGPPSFKAASFELSGDRAVASIRLKYL